MGKRKPVTKQKGTNLGNQGLVNRGLLAIELAAPILVCPFLDDVVKKGVRVARRVAEQLAESDRRLWRRKIAVFVHNLGLRDLRPVER
jgi:hypothetical protein